MSYRLHDVCLNLALSQSLTSPGIIDWSTCFGWMPNQTVNQPAFGRQTVSKDKLLDKEGRFRFIKTIQYGKSPKKEVLETQQLFQHEMAKLFCEKLETDSYQSL
jgi:hypothetical protein